MRFSLSTLKKVNKKKDRGFPCMRDKFVGSISCRMNRSELLFSGCHAIFAIYFDKSQKHKIGRSVPCMRDKFVGAISCCMGRSELLFSGCSLTYFFRTSRGKGPTRHGPSPSCAFLTPPNTCVLRVGSPAGSRVFIVGSKHSANNESKFPG